MSQSAKPLNTMPDSLYTSCEIHIISHLEYSLDTPTVVANIDDVKFTKYFVNELLPLQRAGVMHPRVMEPKI